MTDKQPEALRLADALDDSTCARLLRPTTTEAAALLRTQHAALERKDALLRQALEALLPEASAHTEETKQTQVVAAIKQELSQ